MSFDFEASTAYTALLSRLLKTICPVATTGRLCLSPDRGEIQVSNSARSCNACIGLEKDLFATYRCSEPGQLRLRLDKLAVCLTMYVEWSAKRDEFKSRKQDQVSCPDHPCVLQYTEFGEFALQFNDETMSSACKFALFEDVDDAEIDLNRDEVRLRAILPGKAMSTVLRDMAALECTKVTITGCSEPLQLKFIASSDLATAEIVIPYDPQTLETLEVSGGTRFTYDFTLFNKLREASRMAKKVAIRFDENGVLSAQFMCIVDEKQIFIDFTMLPLVESTI